MPFAFATVRDVASYRGQFLALAGLLALIGVVAARSAARQARATPPGLVRRGWTGLAAIAVGSTTVWAAHVIDLVGWRPAATGSFQPASAAASLSMAVAAAASGLIAAGSGPTEPGRVAAGAAIFGAGAWAADVMGPSAVALAGTGGPRPLAGLAALVPAVGAALVSLLVVLRAASGGWATVGVVVSAAAWSATHLVAVATVGPRGVHHGGSGLAGASSSYGFVLMAVVLLAAAIIMAFIVGAVLGDRTPDHGPRQVARAPRPASGAVIARHRFPSRVGPAGAEPTSVPARHSAPSTMPARYFEMDTVELPTLPGMAPRPLMGGPRRGGRRWYRIRPYADARSR